MKQVKTSALVPGMVLAKDVYDSTGILILNKATKLSNELICKLMNWGLTEAWVEEPSHSLKEQQEEQLAPQIAAAHTRMVDVTQNILCSPELKELDPNLLKGMVGDLNNQLKLSANVLLSLSHLKEYDHYLYTHVVNVCLLTQIIGEEMKLSVAELSELGTAALLHDVGMTKIDRSTYDKEGRLNAEEWKLIKCHPTFGHEMLRELKFFSDDVLRGALEHHERCDGSGYPQGLTAEAIHPFAKIIAVADVYDACISPRKHRREFSPHTALKNLLGESQHFDLKILKAFISSMMIYPIGCYVRLNTGEIAKVVGINRTAPFRPEIRIIVDRQQSRMEEPIRISLSDDEYSQTYIEETLERWQLEKEYGKDI